MGGWVQGGGSGVKKKKPVVNRHNPPTPQNPGWPAGHTLIVILIMTDCSESQQKSFAKKQVKPTVFLPQGHIAFNR